MKRMGFFQKTDCGGAGTRRVEKSSMEGDGWTITRCSLSGVRRRDGNAYLAHIPLSPLYAWAKKGQRAYCSVPRNRGSNTTVLSSMTLEGMGPSLTVEGATTSVVFETYVEQVLGASLRRGQVVVMDNLSAHKGGRIRDLIEGQGCELLYLPSYSPDFNPIEEAFSKIKGLLRKGEVRTKEALVEAIGKALSAVTSGDARGFFEHCGYPMVVQSLW
jgi:transposase